MERTERMDTQQAAMSRLRGQWCWAALCGFSSILAVAPTLPGLLPAQAPWSWTFRALAVLALVLGIFWSGLPLNHRQEDPELLPGLGPGTWITIGRGVLISMLAGFLFIPWQENAFLRWAPGLIYLLAASADLADGYMARRTGQQTRLGEMLDREIDALGLLVAPLVAIWSGRLPVFYLAVSAAYYLFLLGRWLRQALGLLVLELRPRPGARLAAGLQMGFVAFALLPIFPPSVLQLAAFIFMTPFLVGFLHDWLTVCGWGRDEDSFRSRRGQTYRQFSTKWLPLLVRFAMLGSGIAVAWRSGPVQENGWWPVLMACWGLVLLGIMGRTAALALVFMVVAHLPPEGQDPALQVLLACGLAVTVAGTGQLSIWSPEERLLLCKAGERDSQGQYPMEKKAKGTSGTGSTT